MGGEDGDVIAERAEGAPDAVGGEEVTAEGDAPQGASGEEGVGKLRENEHVEAAGGEEVQPANKKPPPPVMPVWRTKRPSLVGNRIRALLEANFDEATEAFESMCVLHCRAGTPRLPCV